VPRNRPFWSRYASSPPWEGCVHCLSFVSLFSLLERIVTHKSTQIDDRRPPSHSAKLVLKSRVKIIDLSMFFGSVKIGEMSEYLTLRKCQFSSWCARVQTAKLKATQFRRVICQFSITFLNVNAPINSATFIPHKFR
jgi:hypothetical protein